ncbi:hypothetical protein NMY22_g15726 [Coprinellus aureogranulatus]|nr:hypothetical protein NMY22_g15726 [Coprinellus aureogranulatus]
MTSQCDTTVTSITPASKMRASALDMSEIDDIFASKGKAKAADAPPPEKKKKKSNKKAAPTKPEPSSSQKRPAPETVVDPSVQIPQKRQKVPPKAASKSKQDREDEEDFKDSRGTGPRRKTEEGWAIYKEAELGIDPTAGDTPLCPFDCNCCF